MSYADLRYRETCRRILREGVWDTGQEVRPHWSDGTPAHTVKLFGVVERYDLQKGRRTAPPFFRPVESPCQVHSKDSVLRQPSHLYRQ